MYLFLFPNVRGFADIGICHVARFDKYFEEFTVLNRLDLLLRMATLEQGLHDFLFFYLSRTVKGISKLC